jgi:Glycosyl transferase family 2
MKICLVTTAKDEKHIIEWLNYHIKIGINYFIIYDDMSDISIETIFTENNIDKSIYTIFKNTNVDNLYINLEKRYVVHSFAQPDTWKNLIIPELIYHNIDYVLYVDVDEFLYINTYKNIQELVLHYLPFDVLKINWLFFGSNNLIANDGINNIIDIFTRSNTTLCDNIGSIKSITKVSSIVINDETVQYGPHLIPIIVDGIVKNIENSISKSYGNTISNVPHIPLMDSSYKNKIYIAHYSCQDLTQFVRRKLTYKSGYYWWIIMLGVNTRACAYKYIDIINAHFSDFVQYLYDKINNKNNNTDLFNDIPITSIEKIITLYKMMNKNEVINNDIYNYKYLS